MAFPLLRAASFARLACGRNHSTIGCGCQGESRDQSIKNTDRVAALIHDLSCSAKAEHPVNAVGAVITGSSAELVIGPATSGRTRWRMMTGQYFHPRRFTLRAR